MGLGRILHGHTAGEEEAVLIHRQLVVGELQADEHQEGEEKLVLLEKRPADVVVERNAEAIVQILKAWARISGYERFIFQIRNSFLSCARSERHSGHPPRTRSGWKGPAASDTSQT